MARTDGKRENQHYVPQMLLRNFATPESVARGREQVQVLDKWTSRVFLANVRNVAAAHEFYEVETGAQVISAERLLSELEDRTGPVLQKMIANRTVPAFGTGDREWLSVFCAAQFMRTQTVRGRFSEINAELEAHIQKLGYDPANVEGYRRLTDTDVKASTIRMLAVAISDYPAELLAKHWFLLETDPADPFQIGDHPVSLHNNRSMGAYGNLGLAVPGIQIYMPVSPTLSLALWCPSIVRGFEDNWREPRELLAELKRFHQEQNTLDAAALVKIAEVEASMIMSDRIVAAATTGGCVASNTDNTTLLNSLQVKFSSRFLMSNMPNFALAERMFSDNVGYRSRREEGIKVG
jgi:hypothetical protein